MRCAFSAISLDLWPSARRKQQFANRAGTLYRIDFMPTHDFWGLVFGLLLSITVVPHPMITSVFNFLPGVFFLFFFQALETLCTVPHSVLCPAFPTPFREGGSACLHFFAVIMYSSSSILTIVFASYFVVQTKIQRRLAVLTIKEGRPQSML